MHTIHRVPYSPNFSNMYSPSQFYTQTELPTQDDLVQPVEDVMRYVPLRNGSLQRKQEFDSPQEPDSLLNTLIVGKDSNKAPERPTEVESTANLPSEIVSLLISLESLSQSLSISHKQYLSHQLTRLSYSLQTDCLKPEIEQKWEAPAKTTPSPPPITPRSSSTLPFPPPPQEQPSNNTTLFSQPKITTDWSGPGSFPTYEQRPTQLDVTSHSRSASVQYEPSVPLMRQVSQEMIYANTSPPVKTSSQDPLAPPLPPRESFPGQAEYQNIPASRSSKKKIVY